MPLKCIWKRNLHLCTVLSSFHRHLESDYACVLKLNGNSLRSVFPPKWRPCINHWPGWEELSICWSFSAPALYPTEVHVYSIEGIGARVNFRGISTLVGEEPLMGYKVSWVLWYLRTSFVMPSTNQASSIYHKIFFLDVSLCRTFALRTQMQNASSPCSLFLLLI